MKEGRGVSVREVRGVSVREVRGASVREVRPRLYTRPRLLPPLPHPPPPLRVSHLLLRVVCRLQRPQRYAQQLRLVAAARQVQGVP